MDTADRSRTRFGVALSDPGPRDEWLDKCGRAEQLGYDIILVPDHLGMPAPFPALVAAAGVTTTIRLGTFVLNAGFYNPALLAREVAATDELSGGRLELGLGAGYVREEYEAAGMDYPSPGARVEHLRDIVEQLRALLADPAHRPRPRQNRVALLLGGQGKRTMRLAAEHADIISIAAHGVDPRSGTMTTIGPDALAATISHSRDAAGSRASEIEWNLPVSHVEITDDRGVIGQRRDELAPTLTLQEFHDVPSVLVGTVDRIADNLRRARSELGITYFTVMESALETFAPVMAELRSTTG